MISSIKESILFIISLAIIISCTNSEDSKRVTREEVREISIIEQYIEPDTYFKDAILNFKKGDKEATLKDLNRAKDFLRTVVYELDTVHQQEFLISANEINVLEKRLRAGDSVTLKDFEQTFTKVDLAIGSYHVAIIEQLVAKDRNHPEVKIRLKRAIIRADNSLDYDQIDLPANVMNELSKVNVKAMESDEASKKLLEKTKEKIRIFNETMKENNNELNETMN